MTAEERRSITVAAEYLDMDDSELARTIIGHQLGWPGYDDPIPSLPAKVLKKAFLITEK